MEVVLFPDIEGAVIDYLTDELGSRADTATVAPDGYKPSSAQPRPDRLVVVRRVGGSRVDVATERASVECHCYDTTVDGAFGLAQRVRGIIGSMRGVIGSGVVVNRVDEWAAPARMPHPKSNNPRYVFTATIHVRGVAE